MVRNMTKKGESRRSKETVVAEKVRTSPERLCQTGVGESTRRFRATCLRIRELGETRESGTIGFH